MHRLFILRRDTDPTGVSLTGDVAEGVQYSNGQVVLCWRTLPNRPNIGSSIAVWPDMESMLGVHGHDGATYPVWLTDRNNGLTYPPTITSYPVSGTATTTPHVTWNEAPSANPNP